MRTFAALAFLPALLGVTECSSSSTGASRDAGLEATADAGEDGGSVFMGPPDLSELRDRLIALPTGIAVDNANIYVSSAAPEDCCGCEEAIVAIPKNGSAPRALASSLVSTADVDIPSDVVTDGASVFWLNEHSVMALSLVDSHIEQLATAVTPIELTIDEANVYWTDLGSYNSTTCESLQPSRVRAVAKTGGAPRTLFSGPSGAAGIAVDASYVYWSMAGLCSTTDAGLPPSNILRVPLAGGAVSTLVTEDQAISSLTVLAGDIFWMVLPPSAALRRMTLPKGPVITLWTSPTELGSFTYTVDSTSAYVGTGEIIAIPLDGGGSVTTSLTDTNLGTGFIESIATDSSSLYFGWRTLDGYTSHVLKLSPK